MLPPAFPTASTTRTYGSMSAYQRDAASLATLSAAVLTFLIVPRMPAIIPGQPVAGPDR